MSSHTQTLEEGKGQQQNEPQERTITHTELATRFGGTILDAWGDMVFLVREPNRFGQQVHRIRLILADIAPYRYGDYESEAYAKELFHRTVEFARDKLTDMLLEAQDLPLWDGKNIGKDELGGFSVER